MIEYSINMVEDADDVSTEQALLRATGQALREHGIEGLTTERVAEAWGKSQSLVHYYYETKTELVTAYIEYVRSNCNAEYEARASDPPTERIRWFLDFSADPTETERAASRVQLELHATAAHNDAYRAELNRLEDDGRAFVRQAIEDGITAGEFRDVDVEATTSLLLSAHDGGVLRATTLERSEDADTLRRGLEEYLSSVLGVEEDHNPSNGGAEDS
ncbi:TetR/AcrR family transcriptional regulator (plasmid) [Halorussus limi]|uniref:TetR/AcrR family transcriptional regulator n=1 Tax=Halorussus limi TaxID=2938695 RepID=A0A8U0I137_9EURY|nr:TetR/AcrR family transcriptional regulator [Halorussus limi]UPV76879.1 TetR/AcrR family transcriptional regulator [Halorussus limi]